MQRRGVLVAVPIPGAANPDGYATRPSCATTARWPGGPRRWQARWVGHCWQAHGMGTIRCVIEADRLLLPLTLAITPTTASCEPPAIDHRLLRYDCQRRTAMSSRQRARLTSTLITLALFTMGGCSLMVVDRPPNGPITREQPHCEEAFVPFMVDVSLAGIFTAVGVDQAANDDGWDGPEGDDPLGQDLLIFGGLTVIHLVSAGIGIARSSRCSCLRRNWRLLYGPAAKRIPSVPSDTP